MPFKLNGLMIFNLKGLIIQPLKFVRIKTKDAIVEKVKVKFLLCKLWMLMRCWSVGLKFIIRSPVSQLGGTTCFTVNVTPSHN